MHKHGIEIYEPDSGNNDFGWSSGFHRAVIRCLRLFKLRTGTEEMGIKWMGCILFRHYYLCFKFLAGHLHDLAPSFLVIDILALSTRDLSI